MKRWLLAFGLFVVLSLAGLAATSSGASASNAFASAGVAQPRAQAADSPTPTPTCVASWSKVETPTLDLQQANLNGVKALSSDDVWSVGFYISSTVVAATPTFVPPTPTFVAFTPTAGPGSQQAPRTSPYDLHKQHTKPALNQQGDEVWTVTTHWDGSSWTIVPSPNGDDEEYNYLLSVDGLYSDDMWAAGYYIDSFGVAQTLIEHYNGTSWSIVPSPNAGPLYDNQLFSVSVLTDNDIWAVGAHSNDNGVFETLIEHWDGSTWSIVPSPNVGEYDNALRGVTAISANDVWAVGYRLAEPYSPARALALHWDGTAWTTSPVPSVGSRDNMLTAVDASVANDVWAVGWFYTQASGSRVLAMHWDGSSWNVTPTADLGSDSAEFWSVDMVGPGDVWAVGAEQGYGYPYGGYALTEHWNGTAWSKVGTPTAPPYSSQGLNSVSAVSSQDVWAVGGNSDPYSAPAPIALHYSTQCVEPTCQITFTDVQASDYFYFAVRYLYCRGAISGYSDNTFRPANSVTRAQLTKILVAAEGWTLVSPQTPHFIDVPPWDPFYAYVETAYSHGIISGYSCGAGCLEFRPGNNITRGQISKVVVLAQGWPIDLTGAPHFSDVPPSDPFYTYIETAYNHGVLSGYADHTFRPGNSATRGQISKVVFNAVALP